MKVVGFFLYKSCSSHSARTHTILTIQRHILFVILVIYCAQLIDEKKYIVTSFLFVFIPCSQIFFSSRRHSSFVQSSILYYIEFSTIAFVLFNLKREQSRNMNVK